MTNQDIDDILCTAFEGGINYWCDRVQVLEGDYKGAEYASEAVSRGALIKLNITDEERTGGTLKVDLLTRDNIVKGIEMAAKHKKMSVKGFIENHDAGDADMAVQFAIFGELIYG
jgi:hypothetical protein